MRVWRICRQPYAADSLTGRGGLLVAGRWHNRGRPIVYTSWSTSLAALEVLVHVDADLLPTDLVRIEIELPDDLAIERVEAATLPRGWNAYPGPAALRRRGDEWLSSGATAILQVPSAVIVEESNFLVNPRHPDSSGIAVVNSQRFRLDPRLP